MFIGQVPLVRVVWRSHLEPARGGACGVDFVSNVIQHKQLCIAEHRFCCFVRRAVRCSELLPVLGRGIDFRNSGSISTSVRSGSECRGYGMSDAPFRRIARLRRLSPRPVITLFRGASGVFNSGERQGPRWIMKLFGSRPGNRFDTRDVGVRKPLLKALKKGMLPCTECGNMIPLEGLSPLQPTNCPKCGSPNFVPMKSGISGLSIRRAAAAWGVCTWRTM